MTHVVTEACIKCKYTDCVDVCPVDCFREGPNFLVIDPDECIDCAVCIPECPADAIFAEEDTPADQLHFIKLNADLAFAKGWTSIPECPVNAILPEEDVPGNQQKFIQINADLAKNWPSITKRKEALPEADEWKDKTDKLDQLIR